MKKIAAGGTAAAAAFTLFLLLPARGSVLRQVGEETARLAEKARPATVNILTRSRPSPTAETPPALPFSPDKRSSGSGFFVSPDGLILTVETVVAGAEEITALTFEGEALPARVVGREGHFNLALLKVAGEDHPYLELGDSSLLQEGHLVVAVGNPFGLFASPTLGIVSGRGRSGLGTAPYEDLIQITAPINPGDAGGPVLNWKGEAVGLISAALYPPSRLYPERFPGGFRRRGTLHPFDPFPADSFGVPVPAQAVGFAITSELAAELLGRFREEEVRPWGWLGVRIESRPPRPGEERAVVIREVLPRSPAKAAGLREGDLIGAVDSETVRRPLDLQRAILFSAPGRRVELEIIRDGERVILPAVIGPPPDLKAGDDGPEAGE